MDTLRKVSVEEAIVHSIWEAHVCIGQCAYCACLAMLRKAVDLWSGYYRNRHGLTFERSKGEKDVLYWRLLKIADANKLYKDSISKIIDSLRLDANDAVHEPIVCIGGSTGTFYGTEIEGIRRPYNELLQLVVSLVTTTMQDVQVVYSDESRWRK